MAPRINAIQVRKAQSSGLLSQRDRTLRVLCEDGAYGWMGAEQGEAILHVAVQRKGVTIASHKAPESIVGMLLADGLATWQAGGAAIRARLVASAAGRAYAARQGAGEKHPFLAQHRPLSQRSLDAAEGSGKITFDEGESPLAWLARRKGRDGRALIDAICLAAGERLRGDMTNAQMLPRLTANWSGTGGGQKGGGGDTYSDIVLVARQKVERALAAAGPELSGILVDVCGFLKGLELVETERRWPQRSAKIVLVIALTRLARHYGMATQARGPAQSRGLEHWGAEDFRPALNGQDREPSGSQAPSRSAPA